ncbi:MAG: right-handed parallel beta-helix repeat-containing protein [Armatimonadetes bacterium]|nr:right-handed parallel beta-helix repeat-containing protein [Armatimonadota bacterium]
MRSTGRYILIIVLALIIASPAGAQYEIYRANLHVHTLQACESSGVPDHCGTQTPDETMAAAADPGHPLKVVGLSDHGGSLTNGEWLYPFTGGSYSGPGGVIALRGFEWTASDHVNVFGSSDYTDAAVFGDGTPPTPLRTHFAPTGPDDTASLVNWLKSVGSASGYGSPPVAQFNHIGSYNHFSGFPGWDEQVDQIMCLAELGAGDLAYSSPSASETYFRTALQAGWHVGPSIGIDNQQPLGDQAATRHTGIWVTPGSGRAGVMDALRHRRVFASEDKDFSLRFRCQVDGQSSWYWMGDVIPAGAGGFTFEVTAFDPNHIDPWKEYFASIDLMCSGQPDPVKRWGSLNDTYFSDTFHLTYQEIRALPMTSQGQTALYLRIRQTGIAGAERDYIYSAPIWIHHYTPAPGTITTNITWKASGSPYVVSNLTIPAGTRLTIEPGTVVKFDNRAYLSVQGEILAQGTESSPIYFTSIKDDSVGGDTNGDGSATAPAARDWSYVSVKGVGASGIFEHCVARYGGYQYCNGYCYFYGILDSRDGASLSIADSSISHGSPYGITCWVSPGSSQPAASLQVADSVVSSCVSTGISVSIGSSLSITGCTVSGCGGGISVSNTPSPTITNCTVSGNSGGGISVSSSSSPSVTGCTVNGNAGNGLTVSTCPSPTIINNTFTDNAGWAASVSCSPMGVLTFDGNSASGNDLNGLCVNGNMDLDNRWHPTANLPYVVGGGLQVAAGAQLTIEPGTVVKSQYSYSDITVGGSLVAQGTESSPIYFTSIKDDSVGGDTNGDGSATAPAARDWSYVSVKGVGASGIFEHCVARYGGYQYCNGYCYFYGILDSRDGASLSIADSSISHGSPYGITCWVSPGSSQPAASLQVADSVVSSCVSTGISVSIGSSLSITGCTVSGCGGGISVSNTPSPTITNCTVSGNAGHGISSSSLGQVVKNCIVANNGSYGVYLTGASPKVLYCDLWGNSTNYYGSPDLTGTIFADPLFVNAAAGDYHLQAASPCIDTGDPTMFDPDGTRSDMGALPYVNPIPLVTVAGLRAKADADAIRVKSAIVTAAFSDCFYVEADDRSSGMRVEMLGHALSVGMRADVNGVMSTSSWGERYIEAATAVQSAPPGDTGIVDPLFLHVGNIGGRNWSYDPDTGSGQMGVKDGFGLNNIGLLVSTAGRVTYSPAGSYFVISDGSDMTDPSGYTGVRVLVVGLTKPEVGQWVKVTGISSIFKSGTDYYPLIRVRTQSDILLLN